MSKKLTTFTVDPKYVKKNASGDYEIKVELGPKKLGGQGRSGRVTVHRTQEGAIKRALGDVVREDIDLYLSPLRAVTREFSKQIRRTK